LYVLDKPIQSKTLLRKVRDALDASEGKGLSGKR